jgi:glycosyltransferase involved in cell wall biosynthesis
LKHSIGKEGVVIKNAYLPPAISQSKNNTAKKILWVGRIIKEKRPELFLRLAKETPEFRFWMIGNIRDLRYYNEIKNAAGGINNLDFIGAVPHNEMDRYYRESSLLINTSLSEGFPNTFLEAWGNCIPIVSLGFDPDEIICRFGLGFHSRNYDDLIDQIHILLKNESLRVKMGVEGRRYVEKEHNVSKVIDEFEKIFSKLKVDK